MPGLGNAVTLLSSTDVFAEDNYSTAGIISPDETIEFRFVVKEDLRIPNFSVVGTGTDADPDLRAIMFGLTTSPRQEFSDVQNIENVSAALGFLDGGSFLAGDMFSICFGDGIDNDVGVTVSFGTDVLSPVPLPASGLLTLPLLLGGAYAGWRRRRSHPAAA